MRPLVIYPAPILSSSTIHVDVIDDEVKKLVQDMEEALHYFRGMGIAAPQLNSNLSICTVQIKDIPTVFINPLILEYSDDIVPTREGCMSIPSVIGILKCRSSNVVAKFQDIEGKEWEKEFSAEVAVPLQHEIDHLEGKTIFDRMNRLQKKMKLKKYNKFIQKEFKKQKYRGINNEINNS